MPGDPRTKSVEPIEAVEPIELSAEEARSRFRWARRAGHPAWLWPEVRVADWRRALSSIETATTRVLAGGSRGAELTAEPRALGIAAYTSGMGPLLGRWIEEGRITADRATEALLARHLDENRSRMERLGRVMHRLVAALGDEGVSPTVLKGMHTGFELFPEPGTRPVADLDVAVAPRDLDACDRALRKMGYEVRSTQRRPFKREWLPAGASPLPRSLSLTHRADPYAIDVHTSLDRNFFGVGVVRLDGPTAVRGMREWSAVPGARVLGEPLLTLFLAVHASEGFHALSLLRLVELVLVMRRDLGEDVRRWDALVEAATAAGALRFAYPALCLAERLAPGTVPARSLAPFEARATPAMRRVLAARRPGTAQRLDGFSLAERFMWAGNTAERVRRVMHALWPAPAGRSLRHLGEIYARRSWRIVRGAIEP